MFQNCNLSTLTKNLYNMKNPGFVITVFFLYFISTINFNAQASEKNDNQSQLTNTASQQDVSITFRVDMSNYVTLGFFNPTVNKVYLVGEFNNWNLNKVMTKQSGSNIYSLTIPLPQGKSYEYKFYIDVTQNCDQFEGLVGNGKNGNRILNTGSANVELPVVYFGNYILDTKTITREKAETIAKNWYKHWNPNKTASTEIKRYNSEFFWGQPSFHVFNFTSGGWVAVSAIERMRPIIGYDFTGEANWIGYNVYQSHMSEVATDEVLQEWENLYSNNFSSYGTKQVLPLLTTHWHQWWPYNAYYPENPTYYKEENGHYRTGCTITAATQMMKYWNYPEHGKGIIHVNDQAWGDFYYDLADVHYDWDNMPDFLPNDNSLTEDVYGPSALLNSSFCISLDNQRGELYTNWLESWADHFGYSPTSELLQRSNLTYEQWSNFCFNELDNKRPIMLSGSGDVSGQGGHAFIADGYQPNGFVHVNFGWADINGYLDGYYPLNNLGGHHFNNFAIIKLEPDYYKPEYKKEYCPDDNTVLLMHFNGNLNNESFIGGTATSQGSGVSFPQNDIPGLGSCAKIDNSSPDSRSLISFAHNEALNLQNDWTIEFWCYIKNWNSNAFLVNKFSNDWSGINYNLRINKQESSLFYEYKSSETGYHTFFDTNPYILESGKWYHFTFIRKTDTKNLQILVHDTNDELVYYKSQPYIGKDGWLPGINTGPLLIGGCSQGYDYFDGYIDELRISNIARTYDIFFAEKPDAPILKTPLDNSEEGTKNVLLNWANSPNVNSYTLQVSTASDFSALIVNESGINSASKLFNSLSENITYYWRVNATNMAGTSSWSETRSFIVALRKPEAVTLLMPQDNSTNQPFNTVLSWNNIPNVATYTLQVSTISDFSSTIINENGLTTTSKSIEGLLNNTTYFWRVNAVNAVGLGDWSETRSFKTINIGPYGIDDNTVLLMHFDNNLKEETHNYQVNDIGPEKTYTDSPFDWMNQAIFFDNGNPAQQSFLTVPHTADLSLIGSWTIEFWMNIKDWNLSHNSWPVPILLPTDYWSANYYLEVPSSMGRLKYGFQSNKGSINVMSAENTITKGKWYHISLINDYENHLVKIVLRDNKYEKIDESFTSYPEGTIIETGKQDLRIGNGLAGDNCFNGYMDELRISNKVRNSGEMGKTVPDIPVLLSPAKNTTGQNINIVLSWNNSNKASTYSIQVSTRSDFSSTIIDESGIKITSKSINGLLNNTTYYWRVNAENTDGTSNWSDIWSFKTIIAKPGTVILESPMNNSINQAIAQEFSWGVVSDAASYRLQVSVESDFSTTILDESNITSNGKSVNGLSNNTTYYWRVKSANIAGTSSWSDTWRFTTIVSLPDEVTLLSPGNNSVNQATTTELSWGISSDAVSYRLQVSENSDFSTTIIDESDITSNGKSVNGLSNNTTYYWRVKSANIAGTSSWSDTWSFTTIVSLPGEVALLSPLNNSTDQKTSLILNWSSASDAISYILQVSERSDFGSFIVNEKNIITTSKEISGLQPNTTYFWRVNAENISGKGKWSEMWNFTTLKPEEVDNINSLSTVQIYPNPAKDNLFIKGLREKNISVLILTLDGKLIKKTNTEGDNSVDISDIRQGAFLIHLINSESFVIKKLVIQR